MSQQAHAAELIDLDRTEATSAVLSSQRGRAFVWDLLSQCNIFGASFTGEPLTSAFNEGKRDIGIRLLRLVLEVEPNALAIMRTENEQQIARYHVKSETEEGEFDE